MAEMIVARGRFFGDRRGPYKISIDGVERGVVGLNQTQHFSVAEGSHSVLIEYEPSGIEELIVSVGSKGTLIFCGASIDPLISLIFPNRRPTFIVKTKV